MAKSIVTTMLLKVRILSSLSCTHRHATRAYVYASLVCVGLSYTTRLRATSTVTQRTPSHVQACSRQSATSQRATTSSDNLCREACSRAKRYVHNHAANHVHATTSPECNCSTDHAHEPSDRTADPWSKVHNTNGHTVERHGQF